MKALVLGLMLFAAPAFAQVEGRSVLHTFGEVVFAGADAGTVYPNGAAVADYPFQASAVVIEGVSGADNDGAGDSSGCLTMTIEGLDASWAFQTDTIMLNGQSTVNASGTWRRVNRAWCATAGSGETNEGALTVQVDGAGAVLAVVNAAEGQTNQAVFTTAANQRLLMQGWHVSWTANNANNTATCSLNRREDGSAKRQVDELFFRGTGSPESIYWGPTVPQVFDEKTDIWIYCAPSAAATMSGDFYGVLADSN